MAVSYTEAERMVEDILSRSDDMLAISIKKVKGNIIAAKSKESFKGEFKVTQDRSKYDVPLAVEMLALANQARNIVGAAKAIITLHENCKLMLISVTLCHILAGVVLTASSVNIEN